MLKSITATIIRENASMFIDFYSCPFPYFDMFAAILTLLFFAGSTGQNITAFLTVRIDAKNMVDETDGLIRSIVKRDQQLDPYTSDLEKLHVTVDLYHIDGKNMKEALRAMKGLKKTLCRLKAKRLVFNGTGLFGSEVLFGNLTQPSFNLMRDIQRTSKKTFASHGIPSLNQYDYHPHMTIVELPKESSQELRDELTSFEKTKFSGKQTFSDIYLCWMGSKSEKSGFCRVLDQQFIGSCQ